MKKPASIYINWGAYDELSDNVQLTEEIALRQLDELLRLRDLGVRFDYYLMDCFWFAEDGGFRTWRQPHWPSGPGKWLDRCSQNAVLPGLWFPINSILHPVPELRLRPVPEWQDSNDGSTPAQTGSMSLFYGGYLPHYMESLHLWYERGVRLFKFDFGNFTAAPPQLRETMLPSEIRSANITAFQGALRAFRKSHPDALLLAYNGFEETSVIDNTAGPLRKVIDSRWLESFDAMYCGDPRPADVPAMNFWRSKDVYSDHMTRYFAFNNLPLARIDNAGFMIGLTGTCYYRGTAAWKGMLLLSLARGGWANTYYGNLELLDAEKAAWFAKAQALFLPLQSRAIFSTFGEMPGTGRSYGFIALEGEDGLITVVNPSQEVVAFTIPVRGDSRILFRDAGFVATLANGQIHLGPEQMALVGFGRYAQASFDLGLQEDVIIPRAIERVENAFATEEKKASVAAITASVPTRYRVVVRQLDANGVAKRSTGGAPPTGKKLNEILSIVATQDGNEVPVITNYDKAIWSGLSWAVAEIASESFDPQRPLTIRCHTTEAENVHLVCDLYRVTY